ncbi:MAG: hypothetical protein KGI50_03755 [Patescibacteria group bacterium]|nr:hypothetical protein [Patescibacteria group bacterium]MDE2438404.1 hypothetical protein [Patescibacteria group bacterium]
MPGTIEKPSGQKPKEKTQESRAMISMIAALREPMEKLLEQLRPYLEKGEYQLIVGDDTSGRIPTLIFRRVIQAIYEEKGYPSPKTIFLVGRRPAINYKKQDMTIEYVKHILPELKKSQKSTNTPLKALIVTEAVASGNSVEFLSELLRGAGIMSDVAALGRDDPARSVQYFENKLGGGRFFYGEDGTPSIFHKSYLSGVTKESRDQIFSDTLESYEYDREVSLTLTDHSERETTAQDAVGMTREDIKTLGNELFAHYQEARAQETKITS